MNPIFVDAARQQECVRDGFTIVRPFSDGKVSALETEIVQPIQPAGRDFDRASLGFVPNRDRAVPHEEFVQRLAIGDTIRRDLSAARD